MDQIQKAIKILKGGGVVVYPTDTSYGLAVDATNSSAVEKLYRLKGRNFNKPIHVIVPDAKWMSRIVKLNTAALRLMNKFLPGPLTLVLPLRAKGKSWQKLSARTRTLGIRLPNNKLALELVSTLGKAITTTSANLAGLDNTYSVPEIKKQFAQSALKPDFYLDGGKLPKKQPSTVVSLVKNVKILRQGSIKEIQIKRVLK